MSLKNEILSTRDDRLRWWREARFGLFIHWGLYAIAGGVWNDELLPGIGEWIMFTGMIPVKEYEKLAKHFNPMEFDAKEWAQIAKEGGVKYLAITAKHHDGFCLFDTELTDYNVVDATPFGRDIIREVANAFRDAGIRVGFYYSQTIDWHHPDGMGNEWDFDPWSKNFLKYFREYSVPQVLELLKKYGPDLLWFDIFTPTYELARELREAVYRAKPDTVVSGRIDPPTLRFYLWNPNTLKRICRVAPMFADYLQLGDNMIPPHPIECDWEVPMTHNDTWGWKSNDHNWKAPGKVIQLLITIVSRGGNLLLNVGPTPEGKFPGESVEMLREVGGWLRANGESIYGAGPAPLGIPENSMYLLTYKKGRLYVHLIGWPWHGSLKVYGAAEKFRVGDAVILENGKKLDAHIHGDNLVIEGLPPRPVNKYVTVVAVDVEERIGG